MIGKHLNISLLKSAVLKLRILPTIFAVLAPRAVNDSGPESAPENDFHTFLLAIPALALLPA